MAKKQQEKRSAERKPTESQAYSRAFEKRVVGLSSADLEERLARNDADALSTRGKASRARADLAEAQSSLTRLAREEAVLNEILHGRMRRLAGDPQ